MTDHELLELAAKDEVIAEAGEMLAMRDRQLAELKELAAKRMEEIAKYRDAPVVAWCHYDYAEKTADYLQHFKDTYASIPLIVKPGEEK